jgi:nucleotidyltransferase substrate binding protein (TIGR01987 family)
MAVGTEHLQRCIATTESAVAFYGQAAEDSVEQEVFRNAIVKGFELTQETAFKLLRRALRDFGPGATRVSMLPVKEVLRQAATHGLLELAAVERWFQYRENRNSTAHDYGEGFARETLVLLPAFIADARALEARLSAHFRQTDGEGA